MTDDIRAHIRETVERLRVDLGQVFELRSMNVPVKYGRPHTVAGWFDDPDKLADAAVRLEARGAPGIYVTLNPCDPAMLARACNRVVDHPKATTTDSDIVRRGWLPFDLDPVRPAGISASDDELQAAKIKALELVEWVRSRMSAEPTLLGFSGNGYHALYQIDLPNDDDSRDCVSGILSAAAADLSDDRVTVDRTNFNASRIWKLYGTLTRKGDQVSRIQRIHRRSRLLKEGFSE
jgi:hypothetical protein